jgi:bifunctional DNA-binding transcriptional regulator/antitoxin component of YhaV-PrlF toxin-antitoxin module
MSRAVVEADGRIRLPEELSAAAELQPGQELEVVLDSGVLTLLTDDAEVGAVSDSFLKGLEEALEEVRRGQTSYQASDEEFLRELDRRAHG